MLQRACRADTAPGKARSEEHTSELQSRGHLVCRLLLEKKKIAQRQAEAVVVSGDVPQLEKLVFGIVRDAITERSLSRHHATVHLDIALSLEYRNRRINA